MENFQCIASFDSCIKTEEVKFEIKLEEHEFEELKPEIDEEKSEALMQNKKLEIKSEENEGKSFIQCPKELDVFNEVEAMVSDAKYNISMPNSVEDTWICCLCDFECTDKNDLREHITFTHKDPSNLNLFKCNLCHYRTEYLHRLAMHKPKHIIDTQCYQPDTQDTKAVEQTNSKEKKQKCGLCDFTYDSKDDLGEHILTSHKDPLDSNKFKCNICGYVTEYFHRLILHVSYHENPPDSKWYHCHKCSYRTRQKSNLKQHVSKHTRVAKVDFYKCPSQSVVHSYLIKHLLVKDPLQIELHQCEVCDYNTNFKSNLKLHMLKHKDFEEVQVYDCECGFRTKRKGSLKIHMARHHKDSL